MVQILGLNNYYVHEQSHIKHLGQKKEKKKQNVYMNTWAHYDIKFYHTQPKYTYTCTCKILAIILTAQVKFTFLGGLILHCRTGFRELGWSGGGPL